MLPHELTTHPSAINQPTPTDAVNLPQKESIGNNPRILSLSRRSPRLSGRQWAFYYLFVRNGEARLPFAEAVLHMTFAELGDLCSHLFDIRVDGSMTIAQLHYMLDSYISQKHHHDGGAGHDRAYRARIEESLAKWNECRAEREQLSHVQQHLHFRAAIGKPVRPFVVRRAGA